MKILPISSLFISGLFPLAVLHAEPGVLDLTELANYANQPVPSYIILDNTPADNPITDAGATLGRVLFYDQRLSRNNTVSCASCHDQGHAFSDPDVASTGVAGTTGRHSMRLINARFNREVRFFWDERAASVEDQASQPIQDHVEMGFSGEAGDPGFEVLTAKLAAISEYRVLFAATFGDATINEDRIQRALAQFVRSIQSFDAKYDAGRSLVANDDQDFPNFSAQENLGKRQFMLPPDQGGAGCASCHTPPVFDIDPASGNNGVIGKIGGGQDLTNTRAPSLRDLLGPSGPNGPFMHDGSMTGLGQITNHYRSALPDNPSLDPRLRRPALPFQNRDLAPLRMFLHTLTGNAVYEDPKWSTPFDAQGNLQLIILPPATFELVRDDSTEDGVRILSGQVAPNLDFRIEQSSLSGETPTWQTLATVRSDADGRIRYPVTTDSETQFYRAVFSPPAP